MTARSAWCAVLHSQRRLPGDHAHGEQCFLRLDPAIAVDGELDRQWQEPDATLNGTNFTYDGRGNLTSTGAATYGYDVYNRLTSAGSATLSYDPAGRLYQTVGAGVTTRFLYDGAAAIAEYNGSNALQRRFVHGPGVDEPIVWYEGSGTSDRRWLHQDRLGSVIAVSNSSGAATSINTYDEYGVPGSANAGRFQYTGQMWIPGRTQY